MQKANLLKKLSGRDRFKGLSGSIEQSVIEEIQKTPYPLLSAAQYQALFTQDYEPGTFYISEREELPEFLFDEPQQPLYDWFCRAISGELKQLKTVESFRETVEGYGEENLVEDAYTILSFRAADGKRFSEIIPNQEYSDTFRRIILFLLYDDPNHEINTYTGFNRLGRSVIPAALGRGKYTLRERLIISIYSGLIGMDIKDELAATSPLSRSKIIPLKGGESDAQKAERVFRTLDRIARRDVIDIDSWDSFRRNVVGCGEETSLCWFTDDYIPTMFEMKFMEALLDESPRLRITIIPRVQSYSNDASWRDVEDFLTLPVFAGLAEHARNDRFRVCRSGLAGGTFNGRQLSAECADIMLSSDYVVIAGARSYEMGQGINKPTFFTGVAICRTYSETVTGICKDDGGIVFLEQKPGTKSFEGFRERGTRRKYCPIHDRWYPVAGKTAVDYLLRSTADED